jgi:hypothetical protein
MRSLRSLTLVALLAVAAVLVTAEAAQAQMWRVYRPSLYSPPVVVRNVNYGLPTVAYNTGFYGPYYGTSAALVQPYAYSAVVPTFRGNFPVAGYGLGYNTASYYTPSYYNPGLYYGGGYPSYYGYGAGYAYPFLR